MNKNSEAVRIIPVGKYMMFLREHIGAYGRAWIEGELSEFTARRGHWYFTIADDSSSLKCVMWQSRAQKVQFKPEPGQLIQVYGGPTVYPKYCRLQFDVLQIKRRHTIGELQKRFLELQEKFAQEGLFDEQKNMRLPQIPQRIGIVTSSEGAALQDILRILRDRFPMVKVIVASVRVQGSGAAPEISEAIKQFNDLAHEKRPDLLIIGRGGGSLEDLWAFNEETVVRAISDSIIPIISAVGHETDTTIADLVADVRAATPTHAAQTAVPDQNSIIQAVYQLETHMHQSIEHRIRAIRQRIIQITESYSFNTPVNYVRDAQQTLTRHIDTMHEACNNRLLAYKHHAELLEKQIVALDPNRFLKRGYARIERDGQIIRSSQELNTGDLLSIHFANGCREAVVND